MSRGSWHEEPQHATSLQLFFAGGCAGVATPTAPACSHAPGGSPPVAACSLAAAQVEANALGPLRVAHALGANMAPAGAKVAIVSSKMGSVADTAQDGQNGSVGYR